MRFAKRSILHSNGQVYSRQFVLARTTHGYSFKHAEADCRMLDAMLREIIKKQHEAELGRCMRNRTIRTEFAHIGKMFMEN